MQNRLTRSTTTTEELVQERGVLMGQCYQLVNLLNEIKEEGNEPDIQNSILDQENRGESILEQYKKICAK